MRCGFFFVPGPNKKSNIYIVPHNYQVDCSSQTEFDLKDVCIQLFDYINGNSRLNLKNPSKLSGETLGDDLCDLLGNKKIRKLPNRNWPNGMPVITII